MKLFWKIALVVYVLLGTAAIMEVLSYTYCRSQMHGQAYCVLKAGLE